MQPNQLVNDVIAEAPTTDGEPVLTLAGCDAFEFLDVMPPRPVIGICGKDRYRAFFNGIKLTMVFLQPVGEPIKTRTGADRKGRGGHALRRPRLVARAARSAKSSSIGRLFPAKNSS